MYTMNSLHIYTCTCTCTCMYIELEFIRGVIRGCIRHLLCLVLPNLTTELPQCLSSKHWSRETVTWVQIPPGAAHFLEMPSVYTHRAMLCYECCHSVSQHLSPALPSSHSLTCQQWHMAVYIVATAALSR